MFMANPISVLDICQRLVYTNYSEGGMGMNIGTAVVLVLLCVVVGLIIRKMIRDKRSGKSLQCGMDCQHCGGHCGHRNE